MEKEFIKVMLSIEEAYQNLNKHQKIRVEAWTKKLCQVTTNEVWKKNKNLYARILLNQVSKEILSEPFDKRPPEGPLPKLNRYLVLNNQKENARPQISKKDTLCFEQQQQQSVECPNLQVISYLIMLSPLIISALIDTTIMEGIFSTCLACIFSMKMYKFNIIFQLYSYIISEEKLDLIQYNQYLWIPTLVCQPRQMVFKKQRNFIQIFKCILNSSLIILWDLYYFTYEIKSNYIYEEFAQFIINYTFRLGILIVINHYLIFDYLLGLFKEITRIQNIIFYEGWWNADGFGQLNRKWNKQVHNFLKINIYQRLSRNGNNTKALIMTYLVTALLHEYCINVSLKTFRLYFLSFSCFQFVLIPYQKFIPLLKYVLFIQILFGNSLLIYLYTYY